MQEDERHYMTYRLTVKSRCEILKIPRRHGKSKSLHIFLSLTPIAFLRDLPASSPLFPHPLLARLLEGTVEAVANVPPLASPTGD
jgi:hypothetical protein